MRISTDRRRVTGFSELVLSVTGFSELVLSVASFSELVLSLLGGAASLE
jgi:hypothetical protein